MNELIMSQALQGLFTAVATEMFKPENLENLGKLLMPPCHTASDVAQDALDAWEHGKMSREACRKIVLAVLDDVEPTTVTVDARAKLERLFS